MTQSPPPYSNVTIQAPPSYKDLFPTFFRTFSLSPGAIPPENTVPLSSRGVEEGIQLPADSTTTNTNTSDDANVNHKCTCLKFGLLLGFGLLLLILLIIKYDT